MGVALFLDGCLANLQRPLRGGLIAGGGYPFLDDKVLALIEDFQGFATKKKGVAKLGGDLALAALNEVESFDNRLLGLPLLLETHSFLNNNPLLTGHAHARGEGLLTFLDRDSILSSCIKNYKT